MACRVKFTFVKGPCLGKEIVHDFDEAATIAHMKRFLTETHHACDAMQSLVFVWDEQGKRLNDENQAASSLGRNSSITVNVKKRDAVASSFSGSLPSALSLPSNSDSTPSALSSPTWDVVISANSESSKCDLVISADSESSKCDLVISADSESSKCDLVVSANSESTLSEQGSFVEMKSYRIRLRKMDNQSLVMSGSLPATATLQHLADEIVKLGHASAGSFSFVLPPLQGRAPTVYEPTQFSTSMQCCDMFDKPMSVSLQKFGQRQSAATSGAAKQLGAAPPLPHKVPVPKDFERHVESSAVRRAAELALPQLQDRWGQRRFCQGTLEEEKKGCIRYFEGEEPEMSELLHNIWRGSTWPDASEISRAFCVQAIIFTFSTQLASPGLPKSPAN
jgi:hypothetical protein